MKDLRCVCGKKLGVGDGKGFVEIKCRCGKVMKFGDRPPMPARRPDPMPGQRPGMG